MPAARATSPPDGSRVSTHRVAVLLPVPVDRTFDYLPLPGTDDPSAKGMALKPGDIVAVPLGKTRGIGVVWAQATPDSEPVDGARLKPVLEKLDLPPLPADLCRLIDWVAAYTLTPRGKVLRMAINTPTILHPPAPRIVYGLVEPPPAGARFTPARHRVLARLNQPGPWSSAALAKAAGVSGAVVHGMVDAGLIEATPLEPAVAVWGPTGVNGLPPAPSLSPAQEEAAAALRRRVGDGGFSVTLLDGVTGSGKTEVYFEAIAEALRRGRQALVLLPEIALSAQWLERFRRRFGADPAVWHSDLTPAVRRATWHAIAAGHARVAVGARSALFLPLAALGVIVVDEEHEAAFKQEEGVIYHARDMAVVRARLAAVPAVLASATPSLETLTNVEEGRYTRLVLADRHGGAQMPQVAIVDLRRHPPPRRHWLSPVLRTAVQEALEQGEQAMLFLNRRGFAPLTLCRGCGHRMRCANCAAWLVEHRAAGRLACHHCGESQPLPRLCPHCRAEDSLIACGPGVERVAEEAAAAWPQARIAIMTSDTVTSPREAEALVDRMQAREIDILVGTQVMAKGHHFPLLTTVGVVDADLGLAGGDLRAAERTFQLLHQVAGRAGRAEHPGRVYLQTYLPQHPVTQALAAGARDRFMASEAEDRRDRLLPPFGRLAAIVVSAPAAADSEAAARALAKNAPRIKGVRVLGPAAAPLSLLRGRHRFRLLLKTGKAANLQAILRQWLDSTKIKPGVKIEVDVDPYSFM